MQMEVGGEDHPTGWFRRKRLNPISKPAGQWPEHLVDSVHEAEGHCINITNCDREGETLLSNGMSALYAQHGFEYAVDDVSGAMLEPKLVHEGRSTEMKFFDDMKVYDRVPREEQKETGGQSLEQNGSTSTRATSTSRTSGADLSPRISGPPQTTRCTPARHL